MSRRTIISLAIDHAGRRYPAYVRNGRHRVRRAVPSGSMRPRGRTFGGGRVRVYGCSPGCLLMSLGLSIVLTLLVNGCIRLAG